MLIICENSDVEVILKKRQKLVKMSRSHYFHMLKILIDK